MKIDVSQIALYYELSIYQLSCPTRPATPDVADGIRLRRRE